MKRIILGLILCSIAIAGFGQEQGENILYFVDSIPVIEEPEEGFGQLDENEIDRAEVVKDKQLIQATGYQNLDGIIYIFTKAYSLRSDSIKSIPTTKSMEQRNGTWYMNEDTKPYSGPFIDYYLNGKKQGQGYLFEGRLKGMRYKYHRNGNLSDEIEYENGISNGIEKRYYEDGTLMQIGELREEKEIGIWEMYHPNGQLKQRTIFNENGKMDGESISYYSTGKIKGKNNFKNGVHQEDKTNKKLFDYYNDAQQVYDQGNPKGAIKKLDKAIELNSSWADAYFARGTMKLNDFQFDDAIEDFNRTIEIEPYFTNAYANRAFSITRKYQLGNGRTLSKTKDILVIASKEVSISETDLIKVCADLNKAVSLGDDNRMVLDALEKHCGQ